MDNVNSPPHYKSGVVEGIDAIQASLPREQFIGYLNGNVIKYVWRMAYKGKPVEDLRKARWYLERLIEVETNDRVDAG